MATASDDELKAKFARQWLKTPRNPFQAALAVFGTDTGRALLASKEWINDPVVLAEQAHILETEGFRVGLPTKEEYARKIIDAAEETLPDGTSRVAFEDKLKAYRLFGEVMGYIERPASTTINNNPQTINRVMIVKEHGSDDDWERRLQNQQQKLISGDSGAVH